MIHLRVYGKIFNIFCFQTTRLYSRFGSFIQNKIQSSNSHTVHITVYSKLAVTYCIDLQIMVYSTSIAVVALWWSSSGYQEHENSSAADGQLLVNILLRGYRSTGTSQPWKVSQHTEQGWERSESRGIKRGERKGWEKVGGVWVCEEGKKHIVEVRGRRSGEKGTPMGRKKQRRGRGKGRGEGRRGGGGVRSILGQSKHDHKTL